MMSSRDSSMFNFSSKKRRYSTMLLLAIFAVMLSLLALGIALNKTRESRALSLLLQDRERQLLTLHMILQKERAHPKEMKAKIEELRAKAVSLKTQNVQLKTRLMEAENLSARLKNKLAFLNYVEEASIKQDHANELAHRPQQPANAATTTLVHDVSNGSEADESTSKGETATKSEDDAAQSTTTGAVKEVETSEHEQGPKREKWVRLETNMDDGNDQGDNMDDGKSSVGEEDDGAKAAVGPEEGKHEEGMQVGDQNMVQAREADQINRTELVQDGSSAMDGELAVIKDEEVTSSSTTDVSVTASEEGKLEKKDTDGDGKQKQTTDETQTTIRGRRARGMRSKGRKRRVAARSWKQNMKASKDSQMWSSPHDQGENPGNQVMFADRNEVEMRSDEVQPRLAKDQSESTGAEAVERQTREKTSSLEGSDENSLGDGSSATKHLNTESYPDTNGLEVEVSNNMESKDGFDSGEEETISVGKGLNMLGGAQHENGGPETREENSVRSIVETSEIE